MMKTLHLILILSSITILSSAQNILVLKRTSVVFGGDMWWSVKYQLRDYPEYKQVNLESDIKLGYFFSNHDLFLIKPGYSIERSSLINSNSYESSFSIGGVISYRRYIGNSLFTGLYFGGDYKRMLYRYSSSPTIDYDKKIKTGIELGYTYFLNPRIGIEASLYYSIGRISIIREENKLYYYSRAGINLGLLYLFKLKKQSNDQL